ncbi:MAG: hypothetical protein K2G89_00525 [Lachnospiraceae bacterium]|nr:hypothetical protein [Lachnospiraceae bacterium]
MDVLYDMLKTLFEEYIVGTPYFLPASCGVLAVGVCLYAWEKEKLPRYIKVTLTCIMGILELGVICRQLLFTETDLSSWFLCCVLVLCGYMLYRYLRVECAFIKISRLSDRQSFKKDDIGALFVLKRLREREMTVRQQRKYRRKKQYLYIVLGNLSGAELLLEAEKDQYPAYYHFLQNIKCTMQGLVEEAATHSNLAREYCTADTDDKLRMQIVHNCGVQYVLKRKYMDADKCFREAIELAKATRLKDRELWIVMYENYGMNLLRLHENQWNMESVLSELQSRLHMKNPVDIMQYSNVKMSFLRQQGALAKALDDELNREFLRVVGMRVPVANKCVLACSVVRQTWANGLNPRPSLTFLSGHISQIAGLPMPARYECLKQLHIIFRELFGEFSEEILALREHAFWYMKNQAYADLEEYCASPQLPQEAIHVRTAYLKEMAALLKNEPDKYTLEAFAGIFENVIALYEENGLKLDELHARLDFMDELCGEVNMDKNYKVRDIGLMQEQLVWIEAHKSFIKEHPDLMEISLKLSFYCFHMDDYERCVSYYEEYLKWKRIVSLQHFAPWVRRYSMCVSFAVRALYFRNCMLEIEDTKEFATYSPHIRQWFLDMHTGDGREVTMLLGRFMGAKGMVPAKMAAWQMAGQPEGSAPKKQMHFWLVIQPIQLEIDLTYARFQMEEAPNQIFFVENRHPMQTGESNEIKKCRNLYGGAAACCDACWLAVNPEGEGENALLEEVYQIIYKRVCEKCPSIQDLQEVFEDAMLAKRID